MKRAIRVMWWAELLALPWQAACCLPGFYGEPCALCPSNSYCDGLRRYDCPILQVSSNGSRNCHRPVNVSVTVRQIPAVDWSSQMGYNPSNASCGCYRMANDVYVTMDAGGTKTMVGLLVGALYDSWVKSFMVSYSVTGVTWKPIGGLYAGNQDEKDIAVAKFPVMVQARYVRVHVVDYYLWPTLRAAFLEAHNYTPPVPCPQRVNMVSSATAASVENCTYVCRNGTFGPRCVARARPAGTSRGRSTAAMLLRPFRLRSRLHEAQGVFALEIWEPVWRGSDTAVRIDDGPWMAWSRHEWNPPWGVRAGSRANSTWMLLPHNVRVGATVRMLWAGRFVTLHHSAWTSHGRSASAVKNNSIDWKWGLNSATTLVTNPGSAGTMGDSAALLSVRCNGTVSWVNYTCNGTVQRATVLPVRAACLNVSMGLQWLRETAELYGVDAVLLQHIQRECNTPTASAWVIPRANRVGLQRAEVTAMCEMY